MIYCYGFPFPPRITKLCISKKNTKAENNAMRKVGDSLFALLFVRISLQLQYSNMNTYIAYARSNFYVCDRICLSECPSFPDFVCVRVSTFF